MSEIAKTNQFNPVSAQPPLRWYFDPKVLEIEQRVLLDAGPKYVGHELMVPGLGDFHVIEWMNKAKMLVRNENGVELLSNICRHRQATMLEGRGTAKNIVCPLHRWTYENTGELMGAPHFPANPCLHLNKTPLQNWHGLLFAGQRDVAKDLANMPAFREIDFTNYMLDRVEVDEYNFNWKTFIEVYQEDYHVVPFHPGLGQLVNCDELNWTFGENFSVQTVGLNDPRRKAGSAVYQQWADQLTKYHKGDLPKYGAIWLTYYPNITVEWYPNTLVVSTVVPRGVDACTNIVEFYYPEDIVLFEREYVEAEKKAYRETAVEDDVICLRMHEGRRSLYKAGTEEVGPYQSPTEDGMRHYHEWLLRNMQPHL